MNLGRIPLGRKVPTTLPLGPTPRLTKLNISCMLMISFSMPVISEMLTTRRVAVAHPRNLHDNRNGGSDLLPQAVSGRLRLAIATMDSSRESASRGVLA